MTDLSLLIFVSYLEPSKMNVGILTLLSDNPYVIILPYDLRHYVTSAGDKIL